MIIKEVNLSQTYFTKIDLKTTYLLNELYRLIWIWPKYDYTQPKHEKNVFYLSCVGKLYQTLLLLMYCESNHTLRLVTNCLIEYHLHTRKIGASFMSTYLMRKLMSNREGNKINKWHRYLNLELRKLVQVFQT